MTGAVGRWSMAFTPTSAPSSACGASCCTGLTRPQRVPTEPSAQYATVAALEAVANAANLGGVLQYVGRMPVEFQVVLVRAVIRRNPALTASPAYAEWAVKNHEVML